MRLQIALLTATAIGLATGAAWAGSNNRTDLRQTGDNNTGLVVQNGNHNTAGSSTWAPSSFNLRQDGDSNALSIQQDGNGNDVGLNNSYPSNGVKQVDDMNKLTILQQGSTEIYSGNTVGAIRQQGMDGAAATTNDIDITQAGSGRTGQGEHRIGYITQKNITGGPANTVNVTQTGGGYHLGNELGFRPSNNNALPQYLVRQDGSGNAIDVDQNGARNITGYVTQDGNGNSANISQDNADWFAAVGHDPVDWVEPALYASIHNRINKVGQAGDSNAAEIVQDGNGNFVESAIQDNTGSSSSGNMLSITQAGNDNGVGVFAPWSAAGITGGVNPLIQDVVLPLLGVTYLGVGQATATQTGDGNGINYTATGDGNLFGFDQDGDGNSISGTSDGQGNAVAVVQYHDGNTADFLQDGTGNDTGIFQQGNGNTADLTSDGNRNHLLSGQYGHGNDVTMNILDGSDNIAIALQAFGDANDATIETDNASSNIAIAVQGLGSDNDADIDIEDGSGNIVAALQIGSDNDSAIGVSGGGNFAVTVQAGSSNTANVSIDGNNNNQPILASFTPGGDAATAAASSGTTIDDVTGFTVPLIGDYSLVQPGLMVQVGSGNELTGDVTGNDNLFATLQNGDGNTLSHTVDGSNNQAAIVQIGTGNSSSTTQVGNGNNVGIVQ